MKLITFLALSLAVISCGYQGENRLKETAKLQGEADLEVQVRRAQELEVELSSRQKYYQAVAGEYSGVLAIEEGSKFQIRVNLIPKVPSYTNQKPRTVDEVTNDLINLGFKIQVVQWNPENEATAIGCIFEDVKPDLDTGTISALSTSCPIFFTFNPKLLDDGSRASSLVGVSKPTGSPRIFQFNLGRVQ